MRTMVGQPSEESTWIDTFQSVANQDSLRAMRPNEVVLSIECDSRRFDGQLRGEFNAISSAAFSRIEGSIRLTKKVGPFCGRFSLKSRNTKTSRDIDRASPEAKAFAFKATPDAVSSG